MSCFVLKIDQDFTMLFAEDMLGKVLAKWPTFFKPRVTADCKNLPQSAYMDELLLSAQQESDDDGKWKIGDKISQAFRSFLFSMRSALCVFGPCQCFSVFWPFHLKMQWDLENC